MGRLLKKKFNLCIQSFDRFKGSAIVRPVKIINGIGSVDAHPSLDEEAQAAQPQLKCVTFSYAVKRRRVILTTRKMQTRKHTAIKWCAFIFIFIIGVSFQQWYFIPLINSAYCLAAILCIRVNNLKQVIGTVILAVSLRIVFDNDYSYLLFHGSGSYLAGYVLVATGVSLMIVSSIGCTGVAKGNPPLLGLVYTLFLLKSRTKLVLIFLFLERLLFRSSRGSSGNIWSSCLQRTGSVSRKSSPRYFLGHSASLWQWHCEHHCHRLDPARRTVNNNN